MKIIILVGALQMVKLKAFSRLKNIFSRLNPLDSFKLGNQNEEPVKPLSSDELLENTIKKYSQFEYVILISIYHLLNTKSRNNEFLTVVTKDYKLIADLIEGNEIIVQTPILVEIEAKKNNIFIAVHNHFCGAISPSLGDICKALESNCNLISIVSENNIGIVVIEYNSDCNKQLIDEFVNFHGYIDICFAFERTEEIKRVDMLQISDNEKEKLKLEEYDKYISRNCEKFVNEFNIRFNKFNISEIYIKL